MKKSDAGKNTKSALKVKASAKETQQPEGLFPVVAIGASAGGLEAISNLLEHLPPNLGMAYVIIQHLSPDHKSILPELLEKIATMPVLKVEDNMDIEMDHVYVIPPNTFMSIVDSKLKLFNRLKSDGAYHSIDYFFTNLAPVYKNNAIGIILSGTATDGTLGVKAIKAEGGITFAQDDTAKYQGMPRSASEAGYVDFVLSPEKIAAELVKISRHPFRLLSQDKEPENDHEIKRILVTLNSRIGVDFSCYKDSTIYRRITRRMVLSRCKTLKEYGHFVSKSEDESRLLYKDLLINVTSFFRNPAFYQELSAQVLPNIIKGRNVSTPLRIWIPGCSTGEEAYSIAICLIEYLTERALSIPVQIFATDLNEAAIDQARSAVYLKSAMEDMSVERLNRFFVPINGRYQVIKPVRDICIFARHNLLKDPPFSHLDIISCHNVLIYLKPEAQGKILQSFHYGLNQEGYLLLGKSETAGSADHFFEPVDKEHKIYIKKSATLGSYDFSLHTSYRERTPMATSKPEVKENIIDVEKQTDKVLQDYLPPSVLVNQDLNIIGFRGDTSPYLRPAAGKASFHLMKMIREELVFELRTVINQAKSEAKKVNKEKIIYDREGRTRVVSLEVAPIIASAKERYYLIIFKEGTPAAVAEKISGGSKDKEITALKQQLKEARSQIKSMSEEFESTREELQSSNEEVLSSNEELQSMNEELETSQEELQSTNEELTTINDELQLRNKELKEAGDYSAAIIHSIREPWVVLNKDLYVITANEAYYDFFSTSKNEIAGSPFDEIQNHMWDIPVLKNHFARLNLSDQRGNAFKVEVKKEIRPNEEKTMLIKANQMEENGKRTKVLITMEDVTEYKKMVEQKDDFISITSHELKTPVTALRIYSQAIHQYFIDQQNKEQGKLAEKMEGQVNRLIVLIENLLDLTKVSNGVLQLEKSFFDLDQLISETVELMQLTSTHHEFITDLHAKNKIWGDRNRIEQVMTNLLSNAIKYSPHASRIEIRSQMNDDMAEVSIKDFGVGISKEDEYKIFDRFKRTNFTKNTFPGLGLGLYISNEIVEKHGGKISLKSTRGDGSEFCFNLPVGRVDT